MKQIFQFIDFIKKTKQNKHFSTEVLRILKDIADKYSNQRSQQSSTQRNTKSSSSDIATFLSFPEEWIINNSTKRKAIKDFIKILLNIEKTAAKLNPIDYRITSLKKLLAENMRNWNIIDNIKNKNKQRMSIKDMNNQNADIDFNQTQDFSQTQKTEPNHESNTRTPQSSSTQALPAEMKDRITKIMQQTMIIFMKTNSNQQISGISEMSELSSSISSDILAKRSHSKSFFHELTSFKWNPFDIDFFDSHFNDKTIATASVMKHSEKNIYFRNIHLFLERCSNIVTIKDEQLIKNNLFICLRELTLQWYISEMTSNVKILIKYASDIEHWFVKLLSRFKKKSNIALSILMKKKYTFENVRNQRESREYAIIILRATKSINLKVFDQIAMIWNDMNAEFQRNIQRSNEDIVLDDFLNALDEFKDIWWQLTRRRMSAFKNFNYRSNQYQYSKKRSDQYQQSEKKFKSYNISESFEEYRKNYFRVNFTSNFKSNSNNMQQYFKPWIQRTSYQSTKQSYQSKKDRQAFKDIENSSKYSKSTNFNKSQHSIYNKFQKYSANSSYQQKAYHEHEKSEQNIENDENQKNNQNNFSFNFENFDDEGNEIYYEKSNTKNDENTFVEFVEMQSTCKRCEETFSFKNLLHDHIRMTICVKSNRISKVDLINDTVKNTDTVKIVTFKTSTSNQNVELEFRSWNFLQAFVKLISTMKAILICLDTECDATLANKVWILNILSEIQIKKMITSLKVKDIDFTTHEFLKFVSISIYFSGLTKNDISAFVFIIRKIHLIDDLKVKMLIKNDLLSFKGFVIDIEDKSIAIESCKIEISLKIQSKDLYLRRTIHAQQAMMLHSKQKQFLSIRIKISDERDFYFESDSNVNFTMYSHILDVSIKKILAKNETTQIIKISKRCRLRQIAEMNCDNCFQISEANLAIRFSKKRTVISSIDFADMKVRLSNDVMIYDDDRTRTAYAKLIQEFSILWHDNDFIDLSEDKWMKISLKQNWQARIIEKSKIYSLDAKDREVLNRTFDEFHQKDRFIWTNEATSFSYSVFVTWKIVNDIRKRRAVIDIREFNELIISDVYSVSSQTEIINDLRDCSHISILDASFFFYQWRMHFDDTYKLTMMTHRGQKIFLISVMSCRNSIAYVQRQMNTLLRQFQSFAKIYIDDIVIRSKSLNEHIFHLRQVFFLFVKKNIDLNSIKVFLSYSKVTLLRQRINALDLSIIENRIKALTSLKMSETLAQLETYLKLIDYIRQYIHHYAIISRSLQDLKTVLLKSESVNVDVRRKTYISKTKLLLTIKEQNSFDLLQKIISNAAMLIHFDLDRVLWIDLNDFKEREFEIMIFHLKRDVIMHITISLKTQIESIMFLSKLFITAKMNYWLTKLKMTALIWIVKKVKHLIESFKFFVIIQIDHSTTIDICRQKLIIFTNSFIRSNIRLVRASQYLSQFSLDVRHKSKKNNIVSDALSRLKSIDDSIPGVEYSEFDALHAFVYNTFSYNTTLVKISDDFKKRIVREYIDDFNWKKHALLLHNNDKLKKNAFAMSFVLENDLIYYVDQWNDIKRLCISKDCVRNILNIAHENEHFEYARTYDIVIKSWYIHDLIKQLRKYIQHCSKCLTCQIKRHKFYESLQSIDTSFVSFYTIIMNFVLTLPHIEFSSDTMLTVTNKFFKRILLMSDKSIFSTQDWANILLRYFNIVDWEYFMIIISDRDRKFLSDFWKSIFRALDIQLLYFTTYHSQTDDSSERTNQTVKMTLKHYMLSMKDSIKWSEILSRFQSVLNNSRFAFTSKSSNEVLYEFKSKQSLNLVASILELDISKTRMKIANVIVWIKLNRKHSYDKNHKSMFLQKEFYAYLRMHHEYFISLSKNMIIKWSQRRIESFKIIKRIENLTYKLKLPAHWKIHSVVSIQQLESISHDKDSYDRQFYDNSSAIYVKEDSKNDEFYEIEKLINKRIIRKRRDQFTQYLVRWKEYDSENDMWYSIESLENVVELIAEYDANAINDSRNSA